MLPKAIQNPVDTTAEKSQATIDVWKKELHLPMSNLIKVLHLIPKLVVQNRNHAIDRKSVV